MDEGDNSVVVLDRMGPYHVSLCAYRKTSHFLTLVSTYVDFQPQRPVGLARSCCHEQLPANVSFMLSLLPPCVGTVAISQTCLFVEFNLLRTVY